MPIDDDSEILSVIPIAHLFIANTFESQFLAEDSDIVDTSEGKRHSDVLIGEPFPIFAALLRETNTSVLC